MVNEPKLGELATELVQFVTVGVSSPLLRLGARGDGTRVGTWTAAAQGGLPCGGLVGLGACGGDEAERKWIADALETLRSAERAKTQGSFA